MLQHLDGPPDTSISTSQLADVQPDRVARDHHYVPRFLLNNFTSTDVHPGKLRYFDRQIGTSRWRFPRAVATSRDYYTVNFPGQPPDFIEQHFGKMESLAAETIRRIIDTGHMPTGVEYDNFMHFLALMHVRGESFRAMAVTFAENDMEQRLRHAASSIEAYEEALRDIPPGRKRISFQELQEWAQEERMVEVADPSGLHAKEAMLAIAVERDLLALRQWTIIAPEAGAADFICADEPVTLGTPRPGEVWSPQGLLEPETDFFLPVHRKLALLGRLVPSRGGTSVAHEVDSQVVAAVNRRTLFGARRYLYSPTDEFVVLDDTGIQVPGSTLWLNSRLPQASPSA